MDSGFDNDDIAELDRLVSVLHPEPSKERWLAMLELYLDDGGSQTNAQKPIFASGGYIAPVETLKSFSGLWQNQLDLLGSPPFHGTDCEPGPNGFGHGDFADWDANRLLELKKALAPLTLMLSAGVGRGLVVSEHNTEILNHPVLASRIAGTDQYFPLFLLLECVLDWIASGWPGRPKNEKIAVVFEGGTLHLALATSVFRWLRNNFQWANDAFTDKLGVGSKRDPKLQAADMLAFNVYKDLEGRTMNPPRPERKIFSVLKSHGRLSVGNIPKESYKLLGDMYAEWFKQWGSEGGV